MFGIGMTEIIVILVIALIVIGPEKLPELAKTLGKGMAEFKRATDDFRNTVYSDIRAEEKRDKAAHKQERILDEEKDASEQPGNNLKTDEEPIADELPPIINSENKNNDTG